MKAAERDAMVKRVQAAYAKWPAIKEMPVGQKLSEGASAATVEVDYDKGDAAYVDALYQLCGKGATPIGRNEGATTIIGEMAKGDAERNTEPAMTVGKKT